LSVARKRHLSGAQCAPRRDGSAQLHLARLGDPRPGITDDVVKEVSKKHTSSTSTWRSLRERGKTSRSRGPLNPRPSRNSFRPPNVNLDLGISSPDARAYQNRPRWRVSCSSTEASPLQHSGKTRSVRDPKTAEAGNAPDRLSGWITADRIPGDAEGGG